MRTFDVRGQVTVAQALRALSNADGSEVQLFGDAVVTRQPGVDAKGQRLPRTEVRGEFLHVFVNTEQVRSNRPVVLERDTDRFAGDNLDYNHVNQQLQLTGRVRGVIAPGGSR
jgi:lipopolysaccharide export system protein LptC